MCCLECRIREQARSHSGMHFKLWERACKLLSF
jgi:hypothetical protein